jgi:hypothetical protein
MVSRRGRQAFAAGKTGNFRLHILYRIGCQPAALQGVGNALPCGVEQVFCPDFGPDAGSFLQEGAEKDMVAAAAFTRADRDVYIAVMAFLHLL